MKTLIMKLLLLGIAAVFASGIQAYAANTANDPVSGLPLTPGLTPENDAMAITICRKPAQATQYIPMNDTVATDIAWYKSHLAGYHMVHAFWDNRSQDTFYSPDGTKGVNITGTPKSDKVFSLMFISLKAGLTEHQWAGFSPSNPSCK